LLQELTDHLEFVEGKMLRLEEEIAKRMHPFDDAIRGLRQIPGVDRIKRRACSLCDSCAPRVASRPHSGAALRINHAAFGVTTNHENNLEKEGRRRSHRSNRGESIDIMVPTDSRRALAYL